MSRPLPIKKRVKKKSPLYLLECSYTTAYKKFRKFNRDKVGYVAFVKLKPKNVRQLKPSERIVCCCIKCENTKLSIQSLNLASLKLDGFDLKLDSEWDCSDLTVCQYDTFPAQECLKRNCSNCGIDKISEHYSPLINSHGQEEIKTNKWKYVKETRKVRNVEKVVTSVQLITEKKKISQVIFELETEAKELSSHLFRAKWQQTMFAKAKEEMQPKSAVMVLDFAENYTCSLQSEVQSHHWSLNQVTVHPVVAFVNASETAGPYTNISTMIFITADRKHDSAAVQVFTEKSVQELKAKFETERFVEFTDCCAGQYRGKSAFADLSFLSKDLQIERHFFESSHGKSSADGMSAVVKHAATKAVTNNEIIIRNAEEFYLFCEKNLKQVGDGVFQSEAVKYKNSVRTFHLIDIEEIEQYRRSPGRNVKPVKGTMKVHSVRGIRPYEVKLRDISCFCSNCTTNNDNPCQNSEVAGAWRSVRLQTDNKESGILKSQKFYHCHKITCFCLNKMFIRYYMKFEIGY